MRIVLLRAGRCPGGVFEEARDHLPLLFRETFSMPTFAVQIAKAMGARVKASLRARDREAFEAAEPPDPSAVGILSKWDCYTMGYAADGRERFVHPDVRGRVYTPAGDGLGVVLVGGWRPGPGRRASPEGPWRSGWTISNPPARGWGGFWKSGSGRWRRPWAPGRSVFPDAANGERAHPSRTRRPIQ